MRRNSLLPRKADFKLPSLKVIRAASDEKLPNALANSSSNIHSLVEMHEINFPAKNNTSASQSDLSFVARDSNHRYSLTQDTSTNNTTTMFQSQSNLLAPKIIEPTDAHSTRLEKIRKSLQVTTNFSEIKQTDPRRRRDSVLSSSLELNHFNSQKHSLLNNDMVANIAAEILKTGLKIELPSSNHTPVASPLRKVPETTTHHIGSALLKKRSHHGDGHASGHVSLHSSPIHKSSPMNKSIYSITIDVSKDHDQTTKALEEFIHDPEEVKLIDDYIVELIGIRYRKDSSMQIKGGKDAQKRIKYMKKMVMALENNLRRKIILKILRFRKNVKQNLQLHKVVPVIEDLTDMMFITIEINHLKLFLKTLLLIAETYSMFGDFRNSMFVYNQLRLACELCGDLEMKIDSLIGLGDTAKKISHLDLALMFIRRALQYAWYTNNTEKEFLLYDRLGTINYHIGDMERANFYHEKSLETEAVQDKNLIELSKIDIDQYKYSHHSNFKGISTAFFAKLSLPSKKVHGVSPKSNSKDLNLSRFNDAWKRERADSVKSKKASQDFPLDEELQKRSTRFSTPFPLDVLIEKILEEPEFDRVIPSPRTQKQKQGPDDNQFLQAKYHRNDDIIIKRHLISINQHTKQKTNEYSFKALFGDRPPYKDYNFKIDKMLERKDEKIDFWTLKNRLLTEYKTASMNGFKNATDYNSTRFTSFCREAIHLLVTIVFKQREESPLLKRIRTLLHSDP